MDVYDEGMRIFYLPRLFFSPFGTITPREYFWGMTPIVILWFLLQFFWLLVWALVHDGCTKLISPAARAGMTAAVFPERVFWGVVVASLLSIFVILSIKFRRGKGFAQRIIAIPILFYMIAFAAGWVVDYELARDCGDAEGLIPDRPWVADRAERIWIPALIGFMIAMIAQPVWRDFPRWEGTFKRLAIAAAIAFPFVAAVFGYVFYWNPLAPYHESPIVSVDTELSPGDRFRDCAACPDMVVIGPGEFNMGMDPGEPMFSSAATPKHKVSIGYAFAVGQFEVTFEEIGECRMAYRCTAPRSDNGRLPATRISWNEAQKYVEWLSDKTGKTYRLLSEAEWEYVARAGSTSAYSWGRFIGFNRANCRDCGSRWDHYWMAEVGRFKPNAFGVYDMHGNAEEWVQDCLVRTYRHAPSDGSAYDPEHCESRVRRGGSAGHEAYFLHVAKRNALDPRYGFGGNGFRVARVISAEQ